MNKQIAKNDTNNTPTVSDCESTTNVTPVYEPAVIAYERPSLARTRLMAVADTAAIYTNATIAPV